VRVQRAEDPLVKCDAHHPALEASIANSIFPTINDSLPKRNFFKADYEMIKNEIMLFSWSIAFSTCNNVDEMLSVFYSVIFEFIDQFVPQKNRKDSKFPHFYSKISINLFNLKKKKHKIDNKFYEFLRAAFKDSVKNDHQQYINQLESNLSTHNVQPFWSHVRQSKNNKSFFPKEMSFQNSKSKDDQTSAEFFANHFDHFVRKIWRQF
jgi:hypothetical protein